MRTSAAIHRTTASRAPARSAATASSVSPGDQPGRWVGGFIGALTSMFAAVISSQVTTNGPLFGADSWPIIGLLGMPVGFALGRALLPVARAEGWRRAVSTGMLLGWIAPPLGAIEILGGFRLLDLADSDSTLNGPVALVLLPLAIPISFVAIFMTIPVGIAWGVLVRLVPDDILVALRVPPPLDRFGVRHAVLVTAAGLLLLELAVPS